MRFRRHGIAARLLAFFEANPDEELTLEQICVKFGYPHGTVQNALTKLVQGNAVEHVKVVRLRTKGMARP